MTNPVDITNAYYLTNEQRVKEDLVHRHSIQMDDNKPEKEIVGV